jgi:hypothetical protein
VASSITPGILEAVCAQLREHLKPAGVDLQIEPGLVWRPNPPTIDVFPGPTYQAAIAMGAANNELNLTVRARVGTPDHDAAQALLLELCDPVGDLSLALALHEDRTLNGTVADASIVEGPSGYGSYPMPDGSGDLLGCQWLVKVTP